MKTKHVSALRVEPVDIFHDGWRIVEEGKHRAWGVFDLSNKLVSQTYRTKDSATIHCHCTNYAIAVPE